MRSFSCISITIYCFLNSITLLGMNSEILKVDINEIKTITSIAFVNNGKKEMLALGGDSGCFFIHYPVTENYTIEQLHDYPTYNITINSDKKKIGTFAENNSNMTFFAHDVTTKQQLWSYEIPDTNKKQENILTYSAAFGHDDSIFLYCKGQLISNKKPSIELPVTGNNIVFTLDCHPKIPTILYPSSNTGLSLKSLNRQHATDCLYPRMPEQSSIACIKYSPDGELIGLLTDKHEIFVYNPQTKHTEILPFSDKCHAFNFVPYTTMIMVVFDNDVYFYNLKHKSLVTKHSLHSHKFCSSDNFKKISDISSCNRYFGLLLNNTFLIRRTPVQPFLFFYWALQNYPHLFLPKEIIHIIIEQSRLLDPI